MKYAKEQKEDAYKHLLQFRGKQVAAIVNSVSRSGMSRRIEYYVDGYNRIGLYIARLLDMPYNIDKGGIQVGGCGMDMIFSVLSDLNYRMATLDTGKSLSELLKTKECGERIYDKYFFDADHYTLL